MTYERRITYGLAACVWRRLRAKHGGAGDIPLIGRGGEALGKGYLWRYESNVTIPREIDFRDVSWRRTIEALPFTPDVTLPPSIIPIGERWI